MNRALVEKYRDINTDDGWYYKDTFNEWVRKLEELGISGADIHFSGFWSQGDGACFTGTVDLPKFVAAHGLEYPYISMTPGEGLRAVCELSHSGNYYHDNSISYSLEIEEPYCIHDATMETDLKWQVLRATYEHDALRFDDLEVEIKDICRGYMKEIYRELEQEYDHQTSDEVVWETLVANDMTEEDS